MESTRGEVEMALRWGTFGEGEVQDRMWVMAWRDVTVRPGSSVSRGSLPCLEEVR